MDSCEFDRALDYPIIVLTVIRCSFSLTGFGRKGRAACSFFQFAFAFGVSLSLLSPSLPSLSLITLGSIQGMCAFCVILGDTIPRVLQSVIGDDVNGFIKFLVSRQVVTFLLTVGISYPLSLYRDIEKLSHASALALVRCVESIHFRPNPLETDFGRIILHSMVVIVVSVAVRGPGVEDTLKGDPNERWTILESGFFEAIGVISFAFVVSPLFPLYLCLSTLDLIRSLSLVPPQLTPNIRFPPDSHPRSIRSSHTRIHHPLSRRMPLHVH